MLVLQLLRGTIEGDPRGTVERFTAALSEDFKPLLKPTIETQLAVLGASQDATGRAKKSRARDVEYSPEPRASEGEILRYGDCLYVVAVRIPPRHHQLALRLIEGVQDAGPEKPFLEVACVSGSVECDALSELERVARESVSVTLLPYLYRSHRFNELKAEGRESPRAPREDELRAADVLKDRAARTLAVAIKAAGGLLLRDLSKQLPAETRDQTDRLQQALRAAGIVDAEIVVVCNKTQAQVARTPSRELLAELSEKGLRCACGRPLSDERVEEALTLTEMGRTLVEKSHWLSLLVIQELRRAGVALDSILIDQQLGGDEIDCLANISGELVLFELKDKEFNLGNAYSFGAKIGIIRPQHSVIVSTERVGNDAKDHFQRAGLVGGDRQRRVAVGEVRSTDVQYVEGLGSLSAGIEALASRIYAADSQRLIDEILPFALVDTRSVLGLIDGAVERLGIT